MPHRAPILDNYAGFGHLLGMADDASTPRWLASWVGTHWRRLTAYRICEAYYRNSARHYIGDAKTTQDERDRHREYGDAQLLALVASSAATGEEISPVIDGAGDDFDDDPTDDQARAENARIAAAQARQAEVDAWAEAERFAARTVEHERGTVRRGDGVLVLWPDATKRRTRLDVYEADAYFPELDPRRPADFPRRVHLAWEWLEDLGDGRTQEWVHRITFELGPIGTPPTGEPLRFAAQRQAPPAAPRTVRYAAEPSTETCWYSEGDWRKADLVDGSRRYTVESFPLARMVPSLLTDGTPAVNVDLRLDFIPVVHQPNTVAGNDHFGSSIFAAVAQLLDDVAAGDTDVVRAAELAAVPMGAGDLGGRDSLSIEPGAVLNVRDFTVIDMSSALTAAMAHVDALLERLSVNARIPAEVLGRVKASDVASGILMALSFGPLRSLRDEMRLVRAEKYSLLLKFLQRIQIAYGWWSGAVLGASVEFGSALPTDAAAAVAQVRELWNDRLVSRSTAIRMLHDAGILDVDVAEELRRAQADDFAAALALLDATDGDLDAVYDHLSRPQPPDRSATVEPPAPTPRITLPGLDDTDDTDDTGGAG